MKRTSRMRHLAHRIHAVWNELGYAQRRMFEIRTGIDLDGAERRRTERRLIEELDALYSAEQAGVRARFTPHGR